jgi:hypothetical protein
MFDQTIAIVRAANHYSPADIIATVAAALDDPTHHRLKGLLFDLSESVSFRDRTSADVDLVVGFMAARRDGFGARLGLVPPVHAPGQLLRLVGHVAEGSGIAAHVFREVNTARAWLHR